MGREVALAASEEEQTAWVMVAAGSREASEATVAMGLAATWALAAAAV